MKRVLVALTLAFVLSLGMAMPVMADTPVGTPDQCPIDVVIPVDLPDLPVDDVIDNPYGPK